ncbi:MAG: arylsulfotransferase family protein [Nannocystales bacterium]
MSAVKSGLIGAAAVGGVIAVLFASGTVKLSGSEEDEPIAEETDEEEADTKSGKRRKRRGRKGRRRGKGHGNLESLGYIGAVDITEEDRGKVGTTVNNEAKAHSGLSLYNPCAWGRKFRRAGGGKVLREARIINNEGEVLHAWSTDYVPGPKRGWAIAKMDATGNLYAVNARTGFVKIDWDSNTVWGVKKAFHHDFSIAEDGKVWGLVEHGRHASFDGQNFDLLDNGIVVLGLDGEVEEEFWLFDALQDMPEFKAHVRKSLSRKAPRGGLAHDEDEDGFDEAEGRVLFGRDIFHANTLNFAKKDIEGVWNEGDIITSVREMNMVVVLDRTTHEPKWHWGPGELQKQHDPEQLDNGNLLVFDNGRRRRWSRVVELDPSTSKIVWEYKDEDFFSNIRGLSQRLPNGGTLVVSSQRGRAFEVTPEGEVVWEYWSPDIFGGKVRVPFRMHRLQGETLAFAQKQLAAGKGNPDGAANPKRKDVAPPADGGTPAADGEKPEADGETPEADGKTPAADGKTPAADAGTAEKAPTDPAAKPVPEGAAAEPKKAPDSGSAEATPEPGDTKAAEQ